MTLLLDVVVAGTGMLVAWIAARLVLEGFFAAGLGVRARGPREGPRPGSAG